MTRRCPLPARFAIRISVVAPLVLMLVLGLLLAGCWNPFSSDSDDDKDKDREPPPFLLPRTSPENVLYDLRSIYAGADALVATDEDAVHWAEMYRTLFHPDSFKFYFIPYDQPPSFPEGWWGPDDEVATFENMLKLKVSGVIDDIRLTWTVNPSEPDNRVSPIAPPQLLHPGWRHVFVTGILLDVVEGQTTHRVPNGTADFYFAPDPADSTLWVVTEWYDRPPIGGSPVGYLNVAPESSTWGRLKALYR